MQEMINAASPIKKVRRLFCFVPDPDVGALVDQQCSIEHLNRSRVINITLRKSLPWKKEVKCIKKL